MPISDLMNSGSGWEVVNITLENMTHYLPRMGYLFSDGLFDLAKVKREVKGGVRVKILLRWQQANKKSY